MPSVGKTENKRDDIAFFYFDLVRGQVLYIYTVDSFSALLTKTVRSTVQ